MKKISLMAIAISFVLSSCANLDLNPLSYGSSENWYHDATEIEMSLNDLWRADFFPIDDLDWDDDWMNRNGSNVVTLGTITSQWSTASGRWTALYKGITRSQKIIAALEEGSAKGLSDALVKQYLGEAYFMQGFAYGELATYFGDVVLNKEAITLDEAYVAKQSPRSEVFKYCYECLDKAAGYLPATRSGQQRPTSGAALGFKAGWASPFIGGAVGVLAGILIGIVAEYYTSSEYAPTKRLAQASREGSALTITSGLALGMNSCMIPCIILGLGIILAYYLSGLYGVAMSAMGMLSFVSLTVSVDTYGPISDNAGGIAEMSKLPEGVREITDTLDAVGNTTAAIGKGFAIGSGGLAALSLMLSYMYSIPGEKLTGGVPQLNIMEPMTLAGAIVGGAIPFLFSGMLIDAVANAARKMVEEVRRQFKEKPGILAGTEDPDYKTCIGISTKGSIGQMKVPALMAVVIPVVCGLLFGANFVGGILIGSTICAIMIALFTGNAGGAWDNGKKFIEQGGLEGIKKGGEGYDAVHDAAVVGDTVGDPLKDTVGPCMDIFIKIMSTVSLVAVSVFAHYNLWNVLF